MENAYSFGSAVLPARVNREQGKGARGDVSMPLTVEASKLLRSAAIQLEQVESATCANDVFEHAHFSALRVGGALIESATNGARSRKAESFWQKLSRVAPEFATWAVIFEESAALRVRMEAGDTTWLDGGRESFWALSAAQFYAEALKAFGVDSPSIADGRYVAA